LPADNASSALAVGDGSRMVTVSVKGLPTIAFVGVPAKDIVKSTLLLSTAPRIGTYRSALVWPAGMVNMPLVAV
jgi:hypothetical protein